MVSQRIIGPVLSERTEDLRIVVVPAKVQRRVAPAVLRVHGDPLPAQHAHDVQMAVLASHMEQRVAVGVVHNIDLYLAFYRCDNFTEGKESNCFEWFDDFVANIQNETSAGSRNDDDH